MSSGSYRDSTRTYGSYAPPPSGASSEETESDRRERVHGARERARSAPPPPPHASAGPKRDTTGIYDRSLVRSRITRPHADAQGVRLLIVDNSGSNKDVATRIRETSGDLLATMGIVLEKRQQLAIVYGSDHCDGDRYRQDVDFHYPNEEGDRILFSTTHHVRGASGGDEAEAFECLLDDVCGIDFGHVAKADRQLILVTDVVGHGMGMHSDDGCPHGRDWRASVARVYETFGTFQVIGTSASETMGRLQAKFLRPERVALDLLDLSAIRSTEHRLGIIPNAAMFLMARNDGMQSAKTFLKLLYEKWLRTSLFGQESDLRAREAIARFFPYVEGMTPELKVTWAEEIFAD